jgi:tetratricopeptide (TPR) repeat protein
MAAKALAAALAATSTPLGILLLFVGIVRPWLDVPLMPQRGAFSIPVNSAGISSPSKLSYGLVLAVCALVSAAGWLRARGGRSALVAVAGLAAVVMIALVVVQITVWDVSLRGTLEAQTVHQQAVRAQFGYLIQAAPATSLPFVSPRGAFQLVVTYLDQGFYLAALGSIVIATCNATALVAVLRRRRRLAVAGIVAAAVVIAAFCSRGVAANVVASSARDAVVRGDPATAMSRLDFAARLNPGLRSDADFELVLGEAQLEAGNTTLWPALTVAARLAGEQRDPASQLADLRAAWQSAPGNQVVGNEYLIASIQVANTLHDPTPLLALPPELVDEPLAQYTLGRLLFARGAYTAAVPPLTRSLQLTPDRDLLSSAHTYIALCDQHMGREKDARRELVAAIDLDFRYSNTLARTLAVGLYQSQTP